MPTRFRRLIVLMALMGGLAWLSLNTLALHPNSHVPGGDFTDYFQYHWNFWHIRAALMDGESVYQTDHLLYPMRPVNMGLATLTPAWFPIWAALEPFTGTVLALNGLTWLILTLNGVWMVVLLRIWGAHDALALLGGSFWLILPAFGRSAELSHINLLPAFYLPMTLWLWHRVTQTRRIGWAVAFGVAMWFIWMTDSMWLLFLAFTLPAYGLLTLIQSPTWAIRWRLIVLGGLAVLIFMGLGYGLAPWRQIASFDNSTVSPADRIAAERFSVDWGFYFFAPDFAERGHSIGRVLTLAVLLTALAVRHGPRQRWFWLLLSLPPMILSTGPETIFFGQPVTMPYWGLHQALGGLYRTPDRFAPIAIFCWLVFLAQSWGPYFRAWEGRRRLALTTIALLVIFADLRLHEPFQTLAAPMPYQTHQTLRDDGAEYAVMSVPVWMKSGWAEVGNSAHLLWYAMAHEKPIVEGYVPRLPDFVHYYYQNEAVLGWLAGYQPYTEEAGRLLQQYIHDWPLGYIIVYQDAWPDAAAQGILGHLNGFDFLCPVTVERDAVFFRTAAHPDFAECPPRRLPPTASGGYEIPIGETGDELFIGAGFHRQEVIGGPTARWIGEHGATLFIDLPTADYTLTLETTAFHQPRGVRIMAETLEIGRFQVPPEGYQTFSLNLPAEAISAGRPLELQLWVDGGASGEALGLSTDSRILSIALNAVRFELR